MQFEAAVARARARVLKAYGDAIAERRRRGDREGAERLAARRRAFLTSTSSALLAADGLRLRLDAKQLAAYVGRYPLRDGRLMRVSRVGDRLYLSGPKQARAELLALAQDTFAQARTERIVSFLRDAKGRVTEAVFHGEPEQARRVDPETTNIIRIEAPVDGRDRLLVRGNTVQWLHLDWATPGRQPPVFKPTIINGVNWQPVWPDIQAFHNNWTCCLSSVYRGLKPGLPPRSSDVSVGLIQARGRATVIQYPDPENDFTLAIEFRDLQGGAGDYVVEIYSPKRPPAPAPMAKYTVGKVPTKGLTLHLPLDGNPRDASGNERHGVLQGALEPAADRFGREGHAYAFQGKQAWIRVAPPPRSPDSPLSVSIWAKYDGQGFPRWYNNALIARDSEEDRVWLLCNRKGRVVWHRVGQDIGAAAMVVPGTWYHVVAVFDGGHRALYVDGELLDRKPSSLPAGNTAPITIGRRDWEDGQEAMFFSGVLDDVRLYGRALSREEVRALYHQGGFDLAPLVRAARRGDGERVDWLLVHGADPKAADKNGVTALHWAAANGDAAMARLLLAQGANVAAKDPRENTPLHAAVRGEHADVLKLLLAGKPDVNVANRPSRTPLHEAAARGSVECVKLLLAAGANADAPDRRGNTPLHRAAAYGRIDVAKLLLDAGANVLAENRNQGTVLETARAFAQPETAAFLERHVQKIKKGRATDF